jgi:RpiR family carbohydrate utilization transcriptional regulator
MNSAILEDIRLGLAGFSRSERKVAEWLLSNPRLAVDSPLNEVAIEVGVSEPTVIRFCRTMGLSGFRELKTHLIAALQKPLSYIHQDVESTDRSNRAASKVLENSIQSLVNLRESIAKMPFDNAIEAIENARQILFVGLGASGYVARDACHKFFRLGIPCSTVLDAQTILQQSAISQPGDVFIAISHTGSWPDLIRGMNTAKGRGATVIALTVPNSPLTETANQTFPCQLQEDTNVFTPMSSRLAHLTVLDALQVALALRIGISAETNLKLTKEALSSSRDRILT